MPVRITDIPGLRSTQLNMPEVNPKVAAAPAMALGEVAEGIASVSNAFKGIARKIQDQTDSAGTLNFKRYVSAKGKEQKEKDAADPDPMNHLRRADETNADMDREAASPRYSERTRAEIQEWKEKEKEKNRIEAGASATRTAARNSREALQSSLDMAMENEDEASFEDAVGTGLRGGMIDGNQALALRQQFQIRRNENAEMRELHADPRGWLESNSKPPTHGGMTRWVNNTERAKRLDQDQFLKQDETIKTAIRNGKIGSDEDIDRLAGNRRPGEIAGWKSMLRERTDLEGQKELRRESSQHAAIGEATMAIRGLDRDAPDFLQRYSQAEHLVSRVAESSPMRDELRRKLEDARDGTSRDNDSVSNAAFSRLDRQLMDETRQREQMRPPPGAGRMMDGTVDPEEEDESISEQRHLYERHGRMQSDFAGWMKRTPQATEDQINERIRSMREMDERDEIHRSNRKRQEMLENLPQASTVADAAGLLREGGSADTPESFGMHRETVREIAERIGMTFSEPELDALASFQAGTGQVERLLADGSRSKEEIAAAMLSYRNRDGSRDPRMEAQRRLEQGVLLHGYAPSSI